jgi:small subunit ribosomal protein S21|tara:strand:+ start:1126 stop:1464 length:339 start_codon:yes stop_codon:yes gene_type:complete
MADYQGKTRSGKTIKNYRKRADFILEGRPNGVKVPSAESHDLEKALKVFKRQQKDQGIFEELRERRYYEKPTAKRYKAKSEAKRHNAKQLQKDKAAEKRQVSWVAMIDGKAI